MKTAIGIGLYILIGLAYVIACKITGSEVTTEVKE